MSDRKPHPSVLPPRRVRELDDDQFARRIRAAQRRGRSNAEAFDGVTGFAVFIGAARTGSTLVGALVDAHPDAVIANEVNAFYHVYRGATRAALFQLLVEHAERFANRGSTWTDYSYAVDGQWQGRFRSLRVIGDKKAGSTTGMLQSRPGLLNKVAEVVEAPLRLVHVIRNPFDALATKIRRRPDTSVDDLTGTFFRRCDAVQAARQARPGDVFDLHHEKLISDPRAELVRLLGFLGLDEDTDYLDAATAIVRPAPRTSRAETEWPTGAVERISSRMAEYPFFKNYEPAP